MITISWSELAKIDYWENIEYLDKEWTIKDVHNFIDKVDEIINLLSKQNLTFKPTNYKDTYQVPVVKQITLFYRFENNNVELLRFWNNYKNPDNLKIKP